MTAALLVFGGLLIAWFIWSLASSSTTTKLYEQLASSLTMEEAEEKSLETTMIVYRQMKDPIGSGISSKEANEALELAVACRSRTNELAGLEHGASFRLKYRPQLLLKIREKAEGNLV